ncbi:MAG: hypothetical protein R6V48_03465 [Fidelibacterota bacterium]
MQEEQYYNEKWSFVVKWIAVILIVILLLVIFIPNQIWQVERNMEQRSRWKMRQLWDAQRMYKKLTGHYNSDMEGVLWFVSAVRDSVLADSEYVGEQYIDYKGEEVKIDVPRYYFSEYDTTFSVSYPAKDTTLADVYKAIELNHETGEWDTVFLAEDKDRYKYTDSLWEGEILDTTVDTIIENVTRYKNFNLVDSLLKCPLTGEKYDVTVKGEDRDTVIIESPLRDSMYFERKYFFFTFKDTSHGYIRNGKRSWK